MRLIVRTRPLLGAISLDLMAVLFGGATALLPVFARDILHVGAVGNGLLRAAPGVGAVVVGAIISTRPLHRRVGKTLFTVVALFGAFTIVFGLSRSFVLSLIALAALAGADMVSMVVRSTLAPHADAAGAARPGERGRAGLHRRVERARRIRVGRRCGAHRRRSGGRPRRRGVDRGRAGLGVGVPQLRRIDRFDDLARPSPGSRPN